MKCHVPDLLFDKSILPANGAARLWCAVRLSRQCRYKGGHTSPTSQEQWTVFSWITVASSKLPSYWSTAPHHSPRQEAVTNRNHIFSQSAILSRGDSFSKSLSLMKSVFSSFGSKTSFQKHKKNVHSNNELKTVYIIMSHLPKWKFTWPTMTHSVIITDVIT